MTAAAAPQSFKGAPSLPRRDISVRIKLLSFVFATVIVLILVEAGLNLSSAAQNMTTNAREALVDDSSGFTRDIQIRSETVLAVARAIADRPDVQALMEARQRDELLALLTPLFADLRDQYELSHLYIHDASGTVFLRVHKPENFGDNVAMSRRTTGDTVLTQEPHAGVELGPNFLGLRGVSPMFAQGEMIGLIEVGLDYDNEHIQQLREDYDADFKIWLTYEAAMPAGYWPSEEARVSPWDSLFYYNGTDSAIMPIDGAEYRTVAMTSSSRFMTLDFDGEAHAVLLEPLYGYGQRVIGVLEINESIQAHVEALQASQVGILTAAGLLIAISLIALGIVINRLVLRPLTQLTIAAEKQLAGDLSARANISSRDEFGELSRTFNELSGKVGTLLDDQKQSLVEKDRLIRQLREMSRYKDEFLAVMSHELRTPLNAMIGLLGIVTMTGRLDPQNANMIQRARANSERLLSLINNILDISRMEAGRLQIVPSEISLHKMVDKIRNDVSVLAEQKGISLSTNISPSVPEPVMMDEDAINKILVNLISNAIKFTEHGSVSLDIDRQRSDLIIRVQDTGVGIPKHMQDVIFESFRQVDGSATRVHGGSGLGLAICRNLAVAMKGGIRVDSEPGKGSTFTVTLPLNPMPEHVQPEEPEYAVLNV